jgi:hypothetical protein
VAEKWRPAFFQERPDAYILPDDGSAGGSEEGDDCNDNHEGSGVPLFELRLTGRLVARLSGNEETLK